MNVENIAFYVWLMNFIIKYMKEALIKGTPAMDEGAGQGWLFTPPPTFSPTGTGIKPATLPSQDQLPNH